MSKNSKFPVLVQVDLTEVQAERIRDFRLQYGLASDGDTVREMLTALFDILDKDPDRDS
jgi:hypothetical protein